MHAIANQEAIPRGRLVSLNPGEYLKVNNRSTQDLTSMIKITQKTNAILIEHQGVHHSTNLDCWSALVNDSVVLVWQDDYQPL